MDIGIIGSGNIGSTLTRHLTALGHQVSIANSRGPASLAALAAETGATAVTAEQAARADDLVIIAVPQKAVQQLPRDILSKTSAVVVDTGNYYPSRDGPIAEIEGGSTDSEWVARILGKPVIKAFNNIVAGSLAMRGVSPGDPRRVCISVAGDDPGAKEMVQDLIRALGFDTIDAGSLADSWRPRDAGVLPRPGFGRAQGRTGPSRRGPHCGLPTESRRGGGSVLRRGEELSWPRACRWTVAGCGRMSLWVYGATSIP